MVTKKTTSKKETKKAPVQKKATKTTVKSKSTITKKTNATSVKKTNLKKPAKTQPLVSAPHDQCFWTVDGQILNDLYALETALSKMDDSVFSYHVQSGKNDFATWVEEVLCDGECANDLKKAKKPAQAKTVVVQHLKLYQL